MVTHDAKDLLTAVQLITTTHGTGNYACAWCGLQHLSALELWHHQPLYHIYEPDKSNVACPVCSAPTSRLTRHINLCHGPAPLVDERTGVFALAIIRRPSDGKFLLVQERYGEGYWVPGGGVDPGESLRQGVIREAREEAGAHIRVTGILTVEAAQHGAWRRIIFLAEPHEEAREEAQLGGHRQQAELREGEQPGAAIAAEAVVPVSVSCTQNPATPVAAPAAAAGVRYRCKTLPDVESAGACWVAAAEVSRLPLRCASEPLTWIPWVAGGGAVMPLDPAACPALLRIFPDVPL